MDQLLLTDDEVAAAAYINDRPWATPLPTVDISEPARLAASIRRGRRSLVARDLAVEADNGLRLAERLSSLLDPIWDSTLVLIAMVIDTDHEQQGGPSVSVLREPDGLFVADTVTAEGLHGLQVLDKAQLDELVAGLAVGVVTGEVPIGPPGAQGFSLSITRNTDRGGTRWLVLAPGEASVLESSATGERGAREVDGSPSTVQAALDLFWEDDGDHQPSEPERRPV